MVRVVLIGSGSVSRRLSSSLTARRAHLVAVYSNNKADVGEDAGAALGGSNTGTIVSDLGSLQSTLSSSRPDVVVIAALDHEVSPAQQVRIVDWLVDQRVHVILANQLPVLWRATCPLGGEQQVVHNKAVRAGCSVAVGGVVYDVVRRHALLTTSAVDGLHLLQITVLCHMDKLYDTQQHQHIRSILGLNMSEDEFHNAFATRQQTSGDKQTHGGLGTVARMLAADLGYNVLSQYQTYEPYMSDADLHTQLVEPPGVIRKGSSIGYKEVSTVNTDVGVRIQATVIARLAGDTAAGDHREYIQVTARPKHGCPTNTLVYTDLLGTHCSSVVNAMDAVIRSRPGVMYIKSIPESRYHRDLSAPILH